MGFILLLLNAILSNSKVNEFERVFGYFNVNIFQPGNSSKITGNDEDGYLDSFELLYSFEFDSGLADNVVIKEVDATEIVTDNNMKKGSIKDKTFDFESGSLVLNGLKIAIENIGEIDYYGKVSVNNADEEDVLIQFLNGNLSATSDKLDLEELKEYNLYIEECDYERTDMLDGKYKYDITNATGNLIIIGDERHSDLSGENVNASFLGDNVTLEIYDKKGGIIDDEIYVKADVKIDFSEIYCVSYIGFPFKSASFTLIVEVDEEEFTKVEITTDYKFLIKGYVDMSRNKSLIITANETQAINIPLQKYPLTSRFGF